MVVKSEHRVLRARSTLSITSAVFRSRRRRSSAPCAVGRSGACTCAGRLQGVSRTPSSPPWPAQTASSPSSDTPQTPLATHTCVHAHTHVHITHIYSRYIHTCVHITHTAATPSRRGTEQTTFSHSTVCTLLYTILVHCGYCFDCDMILWKLFSRIING